MKAYLSNKQWNDIYDRFIAAATIDETGYIEALGINFQFNPVTDNVMSCFPNLFNIKKAAKMFFWYKKADSTDKSIVDYFPEYKRCIDKSHEHFNSNYGIYAYKNGGLQFCIDELKRDHTSRRACFCINSNNVSINYDEIDKLCTNAIQFFIRDAKLEMVVQMRSSNFCTLLPYDAFMFSVFYYEVYKALKKEYKILMTGNIHMQIASLHYYKSNVDQIDKTPFNPVYDKLIDFNEDMGFTVTKLHKYYKR